MNRTLVIGDIHGGYKALLQVLDRANVTANDTLIFLGDYVDGWSESAQVVNLLLELKLKQKCIFLRGNHETLLVHWLRTKETNKLWEYNGGDASMKSYSQLSEIEVQKHLDFFDSLMNYYIDDKNRLFVHAGFTNPRGITDEHFEESLYWDRTLWELVMSMNANLSPDDILYPRRLKHHSEVYIGHTPVTHFGFTEPTNFANVWNIDTGAAFLGKISILDIDSKEFWQSDTVAAMYPDEEGRNHK
ncbi:MULTISPECIES: metallophosphoesterase [Myroides]|uniref:metallophosphoesterase n=1 Tax=Myroides TaxID=76831 RepID=UPI00132525F6|nr:MULTISPECIES: metallophosphoesterase [Myroides]MVX36397.1 serine/threonine protein phosphatase [Myroides sp. LoEW2-1]UVD81120.1 metallophosphoesterase [Myroides albus]